MVLKMQCRLYDNSLRKEMNLASLIFCISLDLVPIVVILEDEFASHCICLYKPRQTVAAAKKQEKYVILDIVLFVGYQ